MGKFKNSAEIHHGQSAGTRGLELGARSFSPVKELLNRDLAHGFVEAEFHDVVRQPAD